jgi:hypothetical protein
VPPQVEGEVEVEGAEAERAWVALAQARVAEEEDLAQVAVPPSQSRQPVGGKWRRGQSAISLNGS